jgi:hypothetical protein
MQDCGCGIPLHNIHIYHEDHVLLIQSRLSIAVGERRGGNLHFGYLRYNCNILESASEDSGATYHQEMGPMCQQVRY